MAYVSSFAYCQQADQQQIMGEQPGPVSAMGVLPVLAPEFVPGMFSFAVVFAVADLPAAEREITLRVVFSKKDASGSPLIDTGDLFLPVPQVEESEDTPASCVSMDFRNVVFDTNGLYTTTVYLKGTCIGSFDINVNGKRHD